MSLFQLFGLLILAHSINSDGTCTTPSRRSGNCVAINHCKELFNIFTKLPISTENEKLLRGSFCGLDGYYPKVCCPNKNNILEEIKPDKTDENTTATDTNLPGFGVCGINLQSRITGGELSNLDEFPWLVLIKYRLRDEDQFLCGGVLINNRYVLTAAHCIVVPTSMKLVGVRLGEYNLDTDPDCTREECAPSPIDIEVEKTVIHSGYSTENNHNDIALIKLKKNVTYSDFIKPICLPFTPKQKKKKLEGLSLVTAGWGVTENLEQSKIKLKVQLPVWNITVCQEKYDNLTRHKNSKVSLIDKQLCAGGQSGKDTCKGDSGGPLMGVGINEKLDVNWYIFGIVSFGPTFCGMPGIPGVYTKVTEYIPWILETIKS